MDPKTYSIESYFAEHLTYDPRREVVWREIVRYLSSYIPKNGRVLEIGAGYCHFINNVSAETRIAFDISPIVKEHAGSGVEAVIGSADDLRAFTNDSFDTVLASNIFEHLDFETFERCVHEVRRVLKKGGRLIIIQPNFTYAYRDYYDDYTHIRAFTAVGLAEHVRALGFSIEHVEPRFLPFSMAKVGFAVPSWLIRLYLKLPWRPSAGQMLLIAGKV